MTHRQSTPGDGADECGCSERGVMRSRADDVDSQCSGRCELWLDDTKRRVVVAIVLQTISPTPCSGTVITHSAYVVCYFRDVYPFIYFIIAMYVHHLGLYCILFRGFLISKINVALQLTKL